MTQPANPFTPRELVRSVPFSNPNGQVVSIPAGTGLSFEWDIALALSDRNFVGYTTPTANMATGYILDASIFSDQASTLDVLFKISGSVGGLGTYRSAMVGGTPVVVAASTLTLIAGLRCIGSMVKVTFANTAGVAANAEIFATVRSG